MPSTASRTCKFVFSSVTCVILSAHSIVADAIQIQPYFGVAGGVGVIGTGPDVPPGPDRIYPKPDELPKPKPNVHPIRPIPAVDRQPHETTDFGRRLFGGARVSLGDVEIGGELETLYLGVHDDPELSDLYKGKRRLDIAGGNASVIVASHVGWITPFVKFGSSMLHNELFAVDDGVPPRLLTDSWSVRPSFGVGLEVKINEALALRVENEIFWTRIQLPAGGSVTSEPMKLFTAGLLYKF